MGRLSHGTYTICIYCSAPPPLKVTKFWKLWFSEWRKCKMVMLRSPLGTVCNITLCEEQKTKGTGQSISKAAPTFGSVMETPLVWITVYLTIICHTASFTDIKYCITDTKYYLHVVLGNTHVTYFHYVLSTCISNCLNDNKTALQFELEFCCKDYKKIHITMNLWPITF